LPMSSPDMVCVNALAKPEFWRTMGTIEVLG
jgi:hypothetical protein